MRWSYKTVHFGLKKDGLLGGAFLDDAEIEETLNEYGQSGWELISMFETRDGVIAVFKQPLDFHTLPKTVTAVADEVRRPVVAKVSHRIPVDRERLYDREHEQEYSEDPYQEEKYPQISKHPQKRIQLDEEHDPQDTDGDIGSIRIE